MYYIQMMVLIWLILYALLFLIAFSIKKQGANSADKRITKFLHNVFRIILYVILVFPLKIFTILGVLAPFILLFFILSSVVLSLLSIESNLIVYILFLIFSVSLSYFSSKTYNSIFFVINKFNKTEFKEDLCDEFKNLLDKINYRILTYSILLILYFLKNCLIFKYNNLENVPNNLFFGLSLPIENLILVSTEALLTFVIIDTIITNSNKLKKRFLKESG